ncbi:DUF4133 domain-containing protein [Sphingobacterium cellulitidis]|uniref:DUF4133 domain-containing protein n=1 Tax=Sphingobacterium cellulitidis TaxID=1768011 RepID=UPI00370D87F6
MANSIYRIQRDINRPIEFFGFQSQYIWMLVLGFVLLLGIFLTLYYSGVSRIFSLSVIVISGTLWTVRVHGWNKRYGKFGFLKAYARGKLPTAVRIRDRRSFIYFKDWEGEKWT